MQKYRLCLERLFPAEREQVFLPDGREIAMLSVNFELSVYDRKSGKELFYYGDPDNPCTGLEAIITEETGKYEYLNRFYLCHYDKEDGYRLEQILHGAYATVLCSPVKYCECWLKETKPGRTYTTELRLEKVLMILKQHPKAFDGQTGSTSEFAAIWQHYLSDHDM